MENRTRFALVTLLCAMALLPAAQAQQEQWLQYRSAREVADVRSLQVEVTSETFSDKMGDMVTLKNRIENELRSDIGISILVKLVGAGSIPRSEGKAKRVVDLREE